MRACYGGMFHCACAAAVGWRCFSKAISSVCVCVDGKVAVALNFLANCLVGSALAYPFSVLLFFFHLNICNLFVIYACTDPSAYGKIGLL